MKGIIQSLAADEQYRFRGVIAGEDGNQYTFNGGSWINKGLTLAELAVDQAVEFELKAPNARGIVYPRLIRFLGETVQFAAPKDFTVVSHSHGRFNDFIYIKTDAVRLALENLVEGFSESEYANSTALFKKLAMSYNGLGDEDFCFQEDETLLFPTGFVSSEGHEIQLYCVKNPGGSGAQWYAETVSCGGTLCGGSVFKLINANWYDVQDCILELAPTVRDDAMEIFRNIEKRCVDLGRALVPLRDGQECELADADMLYVPTGYQTGEGEEIYLACAERHGPKGYGWYVLHATYAGAPITVFEKKNWMEKWGGFLSNAVFEELSNQTLEEKWSFGGRNDYGILRNYLRYTFSHQWLDGKIAYSSDGRFAAFNTGLPDRNTYKYLYAFFEQLPREDCHPLHYAQSYQFREFVVTGRGGNGKMLSNSIHPLPSPPQYFKARSATVWELDFNDNNQITMPEYDDTHILIQRCERIPLEFYRYPAFRSPRLQAILDAGDTTAEKYKNLREFFKPVMENRADREVTEAYRILADSLESVISVAVKKLSWNWRAVVPCYNPEQESPCYLLPVSFCDPKKPDRAMIASVEQPDGGMPRYIVHTVIPLDWAYLDARLVCRPESEWLGTDFVGEGEGEL